MSAYIFDTETTDRKAPLEIIEAAWLRPEPDLSATAPSDAIPEDLACRFWSSRYLPSKPSTFGAMAVHHILPSELEGLELSSSFTLPKDVNYLIGHSIDFDWEAAGSPSMVKRICTHAISQHLWPEATGYSQTALIYMLLGPTPETREMVRGAHGALADVRMNLILLKAILKELPLVRTWEQLWAVSEECRIPRTCPMKRYEGVLLADLDVGFVYWCLNQDWLDPYFRIGLNRVLGRHSAGIKHSTQAEFGI